MEPLASGYTLFETRLGWIGIAWTPAGVLHLQLPESDRRSTAARLLKRGSPAIAAEPPARVQEAIAAIERYAGGEKVDFSAIELDLDGSDEFRRAIYRQARSLSYGETTTYGALAESAGHPGMARETGQAMASNPVPIIIPCHRVLAAGGRMGGFSAPGGQATKRRLLEMERARPPSPAGQAAFPF
ncbi:methylated-DNA--[protein]-cysteine S-methyltransferase [Pseudaminobacter sp. 19-2017]|uniref:methylated-DNA--[protein]-cysteine S-methyltransferase n=1 Tax=Pseudaminobacter soli (ex Zhang et al. 2022) TaxID=2831468 RepID=A0A942E9J9_9HYPH|nr:methylated-DNA--[protein]-cysteine S-methyltransferase [Pseudaminobacter soli]MBS3650952.1 methylated-DNA--[protein]-cysteine S-methyltransferase [Pseudaminobacter soli]